MQSLFQRQGLSYRKVGLKRRLKFEAERLRPLLTHWYDGYRKVLAMECNTSTGATYAVSLHRIANGDEMGFQPQPKSMRGVIVKGKREAYRAGTENNHRLLFGQRHRWAYW